MIDNFKGSWDKGLEKVRWFSSVFNARVKVEIAVMKLIKEAKDLEGRRDVIFRSIGERVYEIKDREPGFLKDPKLRQSVDELQDLERTINEIKEKASEMGRVD